MRFLIPVITVMTALGAGCGIEMPTGSQQPEVIVRHRCGDVNFNDLNGTFGKLQGENGVNSKFRVKFEKDGNKLRGFWVPGGLQAFAMDAVVKDADSAVFTEAGSGERRRIWASVTSDCRLEAQLGTVRSDGSETKGPAPADKYVPFPELANRDYEPCTEQLYFGASSKSYTASKKSKPYDKPPVVRSSNMPVAAWGPVGEVGPGCTALFDLWTDGQSMEIIGGKTVEEKGGMLRWYHPYENDFLGLHGVSMHRKVKCEGADAKLLGVACLQVEVK